MVVNMFSPRSQPYVTKERQRSSAALNVYMVRRPSSRHPLIGTGASRQNDGWVSSSGLSVDRRGERERGAGERGGREGDAQ